MNKNLENLFNVNNFFDIFISFWNKNTKEQNICVPLTTSYLLVHAEQEIWLQRRTLTVSCIKHNSLLNSPIFYNEKLQNGISNSHNIRSLILSDFKDIRWLLYRNIFVNSWGFNKKFKGLCFIIIIQYSAWLGVIINTSLNISLASEKFLWHCGYVILCYRTIKLCNKNVLMHFVGYLIMQTSVLRKNENLCTVVFALTEYERSDEYWIDKMLSW